MPVKSLLSSQDKRKLNEAIGKELYAANLYKYFATCMQRQGYFGAQSFFLHESEDELSHWKILADFFNDRGDEADMPTIKAVDIEGDGIKAVFSAAFDFEAELEEFYHEFYTSTKDVSVQQFLLQFIEIQRKAVGEYGDLIALLDKCKDDAAALLIFDQKVAK